VTLRTESRATPIEAPKNLCVTRSDEMTAVVGRAVDVQEGVEGFLEVEVEGDREAPRGVAVRGTDDAAVGMKVGVVLACAGAVGGDAGDILAFDGVAVGLELGTVNGDAAGDEVSGGPVSVGTIDGPALRGADGTLVGAAAAAGDTLGDGGDAGERLAKEGEGALDAAAGDGAAVGVDVGD
jgi:hypothetical protein